MTKKNMNHVWGASVHIEFSARETEATPAFFGKATLHIYAGEHAKLAYGAVIAFGGLTRSEEARLMIEASGLVANAILKSAGLLAKAKLAGPSVLGLDLGAPIGDVGDIAKQKESGDWTLAFFRK